MPKLIPQNQQETNTFSFYQNTRKRLALELLRIKNKYELNNIVLVLDLQSAKIISTLFTITELVNYSVVFIERLEVARKPLEHHAIYFITPNEQSVTSMLRDFQNEEKPQYRKAHVLFTGTLGEQQMKIISKNINFLKKLARHSFKQFYFQLEIISDNCIHMNLPYLTSAYSQDNPKEKQLRALIAKRFVHLAAAYPSLHTVRFLYDKSTPNKIAERVIEKSAKEMKAYLMKLLDSNSTAINPNAPDLTFFVVDRSIDVISPIIHGYAYESLLYDILNQGGKAKQEYQKLPKQIFDEFRYRHISHALQQLPQRLDELLAKINKPGKLDPMQVKKMIEDKEKLNIHVEILHRLFEKYQEKHLNQIGELELSLATGVTEDSKQTSSTELVAKVVNHIQNNKILSMSQLLRLTMLILACIRLSKEDYQTLLSLFSQQNKISLTNLVALGISYDKKLSKSTKNIEKSTMDRAKQLLQEKSIPSERFESALEITLPKLVELLKKDIKGSERKGMGEVIVSVTSEEGLLPRFDPQRLVCFVCGGLSQTEICSVRRNISLNPIVLASDSILTPQDFVQSLRKIDILGK